MSSSIITFLFSVLLNYLAISMPNMSKTSKFTKCTHLDVFSYKKLLTFSLRANFFCLKVQITLKYAYNICSAKRKTVIFCTIIKPGFNHIRSAGAFLRDCFYLPRANVRLSG